MSNDFEDFLEDDEAEGDADKFLLVDLGEESYGIPISNIIQIVEMQPITHIPDMPNYVKGIINIRGQIIPTIDLRSRFHLPEKEADKKTCIVIIAHENNSMGLIVDTVSEVRSIPKDDVAPAPQVKNLSINERYILGLAKVGDEVKILLDINKLFSEQDVQAIANRI